MLTVNPYMVLWRRDGASQLSACVLRHSKTVARCDVVEFSCHMWQDVPILHAFFCHKTRLALLADSGRLLAFVSTTA